MVGDTVDRPFAHSCWSQSDRDADNIRHSPPPKQAFLVSSTKRLFLVLNTKPGNINKISSNFSTAGGSDAEEKSAHDTTAYSNLPRDNGSTFAKDPQENSALKNFTSEKSPPWLAWAFKGWFLLLAHTICSIALSLTIAFAINGYDAVDTSTPRYLDGKLHLRVSDITTLVSMGLVVNKFITTSWTAVAMWRCGDVVMRITTGRSLPQDSSKRSYILPPWAKYLFPPQRKIWSWAILSILLCILPQQFIAPLLSGAVNWNPVSVPGSGRILVNSTDPAASAVYWEQYAGYASTAISVRQMVIAKAQGLVSLAWSDSSTTSGNGSSLTGNGCRHIVENNGLARNSTLLDSIVPCIRIQNIDWATSLSDISSSVANDVFSDSSSHLSEVNVSLALHAVPGQVRLFNPNLLWNSSTEVLPASTIVSGRQTLSVSVADEGEGGKCTNMPIGPFGNINNIPQNFLHYYYRCHAFANVTITAGVTRSPVSMYLSPNVVEDQTPIDQVAFEPSLWSQEALWLLPDVLSQLALANATQMPTWDNLEAYVENIVRQAYLASWDALHQTFDERTITNTTISTAIPAVSRIQASVSNERVFSWLGVSLLLLVGGLLLELPLFATKPDEEAMKKATEGVRKKAKEEFTKEFTEGRNELLMGSVGLSDT